MHQVSVIPRRAGVSSFGFGGTNAHVVLEEPPVIAQKPEANKPAYLITLSAKNDKSLKQMTANLADWVKAQSEPVSLEAMSYTLNQGRMHFDKRIAMVVKNSEELTEKLNALSQGKIPDGCFSGDANKKPDDAAIYAKVLD